MLISDIIHENPKTVEESTSVVEALKILVKERVNALVVTNKKHRVTGILSLQDIAGATVPTQFRKNIRMAAAMYKRGFFTEMCQQLKDQSVKSIMRTEFVTVERTDNIMAVTADFLKNDLYVVPVIEGSTLVGVVTRSEIKKALLYGMREIATTK